MKKLLVTLFLFVTLAGTYLVYNRYKRNITQFFPYPYTFKTQTDLNSIAPIAIIGDRLGVRLSTFSDIMAREISTNLVKKIEITSFAQKNYGLHRTLDQLKRMKKFPKIVVYLGGSEEYFESRFDQKDIKKIQDNVKLFQDARVQTALVLAPKISRLLYHPVNFKNFEAQVVHDETKYEDDELMKRNELLFTIFKKEIDDLIDLVQENNSILIMLTTPISPEVSPKKACAGTLSSELSPLLNETNDLIKESDYKQAYEKSRELSLIANSNANVHYTHALVSKNVGKDQEAISSLELASAFDCEMWRGNPVFNSILRETASRRQIILYDFQRMLLADWQKNTLFLDDIYPQNLYFEKASISVARKIKTLLRL